jgi:hypothetical protein
VEVIVLRHQLKVLKRQLNRPRLRRRDRFGHGGDEQGAPSTPLVLVRGEPADDPSLAPRAGAQEVDLPPTLGWRQASPQRGGTGAHPAHGTREPEMGMHPEVLIPSSASMREVSASRSGLARLGLHGHQVPRADYLLPDRGSSGHREMRMQGRSDTLRSTVPVARHAARRSSPVTTTRGTPFVSHLRHQGQARAVPPAHRASGMIRERRRPRSRVTSGTL